MISICQWGHLEERNLYSFFFFFGWPFKRQINVLDLRVNYLKVSKLCWVNVECIYFAQNKN